MYRQDIGEEGSSIDSCFNIKEKHLKKGNRTRWTFDIHPIWKIEWKISKSLTLKVVTLPAHHSVRRTTYDKVKLILLMLKSNTSALLSDWNCSSIEPSGASVFYLTTNCAKQWPWGQLCTFPGSALFVWNLTCCKFSIIVICWKKKKESMNQMQMCYSRPVCK